MAILKTPAEVEVMAEAGRRLAEVLLALQTEVKVGVKTLYLDELALKLIRGAEAEPAFLGYRPAGSRKAYPYSLCVSLNNTVVHGLPSDYLIKDGDLVKLDLGLRYKGFYVDSAVTVGAGRVGREALRLLNVTKEALDRAVAEARPGRTLGDIGNTIEKLVKKNKFSVVRALIGHGIGRELHEEPQVLNFGRAGGGEELRAGMVLAIEPMVAMGSGEVRQQEDESFATADGSLAAHFEYTVAITKDGPRILTKV